MPPHHRRPRAVPIHALLGVLARLAPAAVVAVSQATHALAQGAADAAARLSSVRVFTGARIVTMARGADGRPAAEAIENAVLVVRDGRVAAVGRADQIDTPPGAEYFPCDGLWILPGFVDTHSHIGGASGGDGSDPIQPEARILDALDPRAPSIQKAQAGGITTANVMPGSGHLCSGQTLYVKLKDLDRVEELAIWRDGSPHGGLKMANGTNSRGEAPFPGTRAKSAALVRAEFIAAEEYEKKRVAAAGDAAKLPARDLGLEALVECLDGRRIVQHHTHRADDILTVLRLGEEFGFQAVLHHVSEGWVVADAIAAAGAPCSVIVVDSPGGKLEARDMRWENAAILERAGVKVAIHTDDPVTDSRLFLRSAALAVRGGLSREGALAALTIHGAEMLGLEARSGSLEVGKDADFVVLSGEPLSIYTQVLQTWVEGQRVFDRADPKDYLWAVGGFGAGNERELEDCCGGELDGWAEVHAEAGR